MDGIPDGERRALECELLPLLRNGFGYYEFYSMATDSNNQQELAPAFADTAVHFTACAPALVEEQPAGTPLTSAVSAVDFGNSGGLEHRCYAQLYPPEQWDHGPDGGQRFDRWPQCRRFQRHDCAAFDRGRGGQQHLCRHLLADAE